MFDLIIVTSPSQKIATVYQKELDRLKYKLPCLKACRGIFCVADPKNKRVGSGGGTLNALDVAIHQFGSTEVQSSKTLVIHSGGDSRRAPFHSITGKAWASLNAFVDGKSIASPIALLIYEISSFASRIPHGSLTVASCDVLLDMAPRSEIELQSIVIPTDAVTIIGVPEKPETAKNHGVLVLKETATTARFLVSPAQNYVQKPSIDDMKAIGAIKISASGEEYALIDTGVVIICGGALVSFCELLKDKTIVKCTSRYAEEVPEDLTNLRLELYSDILLALQMHGKENSIEFYISNLGIAKETLLRSDDPYVQALVVLYGHLSGIALNMMTIFDGVFCHLGTSQELLELATHAVQDSFGEAGSKFSLLASKYRLCKEVNTLIMSRGRSEQRGEKRYISINSTIDFSIPNSSIGEGTLIEHSCLAGNFKFGQSCIVSHIQAEFSSKLILLDNMMAQQVTATLDGLEDCVHYLVVVGINDDFKAQYLSSRATICGKSWKDFFEATGLSPDDIWGDTHEDERSLWTARLYRQLTHGSLDNYDATWMQYVGRVDPEMYRDSKETFRISLRMSVSKLFLLGDSSAMHEWRHFLGTAIRQMKRDTSDCPIKKLEGDGLLLSTSVATIFDISKTSIDRVKMWLSTYHDTLSMLPVADDLHILPPESGSDALKGSQTLSPALPSDVKHSLHRSARPLTEGRTLKEPLTDSAVNLVGGGRGGSESDQRQVVHAVLVLLFMASLTNPDLFFSSTTSDTERFCQSLLECIFVHLGSEPGSYTFKEESILPFTEIFTALVAKINEVRADYDSEKFDLVTLYLTNLLTSGGIRTISIVLRSINILIDITILEFQPRLIILYAWIRSLFEELLGMTVDAQSESFLRDFPVYSSDSFSGSIDQRRNQIADLLSNYLKQKLSFFESEYVCISSTHAFEPRGHQNFAKCIEALSQKIVSYHVQFSLDVRLEKSMKISYIPELVLQSSSKFRGVFVAKAPVRIDLAGGWSDTPPCSYETDGAVLNVAVKIDKVHPIRCEARFVDEPIVYLKSVKEIISGESFTRRFEVYEECQITTLADFSDASNPSANCSLIKAVLITLGLKQLIENKYDEMGMLSDTPETFSTFISTFFGAGIEIAGISSLPAGSGMGGSSVLAAAVLSAVGSLFGLDMTADSLVYLVSEVEQVMTTGGGWQDQIGAIYPGFKLGYSKKGLPMTINCRCIPIPESFVKQFESRTFLLYTGKQRLAKDTLINALRKCALTPVPRCFDEQKRRSVLLRLTSEAQNATQNLGNVDEKESEIEFEKLASVVSSYWSLKTEMAAGSEPSYIQELLNVIRPICCGLSLCGAGAGGFVVLFLKRDFTRDSLSQQLHSSLPAGIDPLELTIHEIEIDFDGIVPSKLETSSEHDISYFLHSSTGT